MFYVPSELSLPSTQFFVLNLIVDLVYCLKSLLFFDIPLLYYYINRRSYIFLLKIYISLGISLLCSFVIVPDLLWGEVLKTFIIYLVIILPFKSLVTLAVFQITLFEVVLRASIAGYLAWSMSFWLWLPVKIYLSFYQCFTNISRLNWIEHHFFISYTLINN